MSPWRLNHGPRRLELGSLKHQGAPRSSSSRPTRSAIRDLRPSRLPATSREGPTRLPEACLSYKAMDAVPAAGPRVPEPPA